MKTIKGIKIYKSDINLILKVGTMKSFLTWLRYAVKSDEEFPCIKKRWQKKYTFYPSRKPYTDGRTLGIRGFFALYKLRKDKQFRKELFSHLKQFEVKK